MKIISFHKKLPILGAPKSYNPGLRITFERRDLEIKTDVHIKGLTPETRVNQQDGRGPAQRKKGQELAGSNIEKCNTHNTK